MDYRQQLAMQWRDPSQRESKDVALPAEEEQVGTCLRWGTLVCRMGLSSTAAHVTCKKAPSPWTVHIQALTEEHLNLEQLQTFRLPNFVRKTLAHLPHHC